MHAREEKGLRFERGAALLPPATSHSARTSVFSDKDARGPAVLGLADGTTPGTRLPGHSSNKDAHGSGRRWQ
jgi:hypothetical protein